MRKSQLLTAACVAALASSLNAQTLVDSGLTVTGVRTSGPTLDQPTGFVFIGANDALVIEKATGNVHRLNTSTGAVSSTIALDLAVNSRSERGLLGVALDPEFATNNHVYLYYSRSTTAGDTTTTGEGLDQRVSRFTWNGGTGLLSSEQLVLTLPITTGPNHDGGIIMFGPPDAAPADQKLFIIIGDLNRNGMNQNYPAGGSSDDTGVIIRINKDGSTPSDNPFFNVAGANAALKRQWAYGIRNSFGMDWDTFATPDNLWTTENGPNLFDEINLAFAGYNSGWENVMGPTSRGNSVVSGGSGAYVQFGGLGTYSEPEFSFVTPVAVTSIHFVRGQGLGAAYEGDCIVGDNNNNGRLYKFEMNPARDGFVLSGNLADKVFDDTDTLSLIQFGSGFGVVTGIKTGPDGRLYVLSLGNGQLYRIAPVTPTPSPSPSPSPSLTPSPSPSLTPSPTPSPTPLQPELWSLY